MKNEGKHISCRSDGDSYHGNGGACFGVGPDAIRRVAC